MNVVIWGHNINTNNTIRQKFSDALNIVGK